MAMGFGKFYENKVENIPEGSYADMAKKYNVKEIESPEELLIEKDFGPAYLLKEFPFYTSPFWNMKMKDSETAEKIDVIMGG
jgi:aspartyl/asparaginyl-tRNA synthetase